MNAWLKATLLTTLVLTAGTRAYADGLVVLNLQEYGFTSPSHTSFGTNSNVGVPVSGSNTDTGTGYSASASASSAFDGLHASVNVSTDGTTSVSADGHAIMALDIVESGNCGLSSGQICSSAGYVVWTITANGTISTAGSGRISGGLGATTNDGQGAWGAQSGGGLLTGGIQTWTLAPTPFVSNGASSPCTDGTVGCSDSSISIELALGGNAGDDSNGVPNGLPGTAILNYADTATITGDVYDANGNLLHQYFFGPSTTAAPEPSSMLLLGSGILGILGVAGRKLLG